MPILDAERLNGLKLERINLKDQVTQFLRSEIIGGQIQPGTKLVEREVAELLGISRAPARDALMQLEKEGLIVTRPDARYVIMLTERDIRELHQVRLALESLAVDLATQHTCAENQAAQIAVLKKMEDAVTQDDHSAFARSDLEGHSLVWKQANNNHLERSLHSMIGPMFMFMASAAEYYDWQETLELHRDLVRCINAGDRAAAQLSIERHMANSRDRAIGVLKARATNRHQSSSQD